MSRIQTLAIGTIAVVVLLSFSARSAAQGAACGGHRIHWIGGAPGFAFDPGRGIHTPPVRTEPDGMDRTLWDALVFDAYDYPTADSERPGDMVSLPLEQRRTLVMHRETVPTIRICIQSADESFTGERLARYTQPSWWAHHIKRWTNLSWNNTVRISQCTGDPPRGWIYVREGTEGEVSDTAIAHAASWRTYSHGIRSGSGWTRSEIVWNPEMVRNTARIDDENFEETLAHELGHVLGLWHAPPGSGFVMMGKEWASGYPDNERWLAQWAYWVGPDVQYPGVRRGTPVPALPLPALGLLAALLAAGAARARRRLTG